MKLLSAVRGCRKPSSFMIGMLLLLTILPLHGPALGAEGHFVEGNFLANLYGASGEQVDEPERFALGANLGHGSFLTKEHALIVTVGRDWLEGRDGQQNATLTSIAFFIRRYLPSWSYKRGIPFLVMGSDYGRYEVSGQSGSLRTGGLVIGAGGEVKVSKRWRVGLELSYRGFRFSRLGTEALDRIQVLGISIGLQHVYYQTPSLSQDESGSGLK